MRNLLRFCLRPPTRYLLAWFLAVTAAGITFFLAWTMFDTPKRADGTSKRRGGNSGHATIDFGGQWLMGRMLAQGLGRHLYDRNCLREVVREAYPREDEIPPEERSAAEADQHDAENMMCWLMGSDEPAAGPPVGGALYPPIHGLIMYPLGLLRPTQAYRVQQVLGILLALLAGAGISLLSEGRIWWPMAVVGVIFFPGFASALNLGQNSILTLTLLIWGWVFMTRNRPVSGGIVWGVLAFKPVWAAAFFLVPLVTRRWRACLAMLLTGLGLAAATLPLVGWQSWLSWFQIGHEASVLYATNKNWILLSRDLLSIPRRWLIDFNGEDSLHQSLAATIIGWGLLVAVMACTAALGIFRKEQSRAPTGPAAAFLLLGAWLSCYHFMYYDILLTALPVMLLLTEPGRYLKPVLVAVAILPDTARTNSLVQGYQPSLDGAAPSANILFPVSDRNLCVRNSMTLTLIALLAISDLLLPGLALEVAISAPVLKHLPIPTPIQYSTAYDGTPWSTFCILGLWLWCGWLWLRTPRDAVSTARSETPSSDGLPAVPAGHAAQLV